MIFFSVFFFFSLKRKREGPRREKEAKKRHVEYLDQLNRLDQLTQLAQPDRQQRQQQQQQWQESAESLEVLEVLESLEALETQELAESLHAVETLGPEEAELAFLESVTDGPSIQQPWQLCEQDLSDVSSVASDSTSQSLIEPTPRASKRTRANRGTSRGSPGGPPRLEFLGPSSPPRAHSTPKPGRRPPVALIAETELNKTDEIHSLYDELEAWGLTGTINKR